MAFLRGLRTNFSRSLNGFLFDDCFARYLRRGFAIIPVKECSLETKLPLDVDLDLGDYIQRSFYLFGYPSFTYELLRFCDKETAFFDIGANLGLITLAVARIIPAQFLFAFEPEPRNFEKLKVNFSKNCPKAHAIQTGLSDVEGKMELKSVAHDSGSASFEIDYLDHRTSANEYSSSSNTTVAAVTTFDSFSKTIDLSSRTKVAIKIDVEGHELSVLRGMRQFLKEPAHQICVVVETHKQNYDAVNELLTAERLVLRWPLQPEVEAFRSGNSSAIDLIYFRP